MGLLSNYIAKETKQAFKQLVREAIDWTEEHILEEDDNLPPPNSNVNKKREELKDKEIAKKILDGMWR